MYASDGMKNRFVRQAADEAQKSALGWLTQLSDQLAALIKTQRSLYGENQALENELERMAAEIEEAKSYISGFGFSLTHEYEED